MDSLSFEEAILFCFNEPLRTVGWRLTFGELKSVMKVRLNYEVTKVFQDFENFATIVAKAFGGETKKSAGSSGEKKPMTQAEIIEGVRRVNAAYRGK